MLDEVHDGSNCNVDLKMLEEQIAAVLVAAGHDTPGMRDFFTHTVHILMHISNVELRGMSFGVKQGERVLFFTYGDDSEKSEAILAKTVESMRMLRKIREDKAKSQN